MCSWLQLGPVWTEYALASVYGVGALQWAGDDLATDEAWCKRAKVRRACRIAFLRPPCVE